MGLCRSFFLCFLILGTSSSVFAIEFKSPLFKDTTSFGWSLSLGYLVGDLGNTTDTTSRSMSFAPLDLFMGYRKRHLRIGANIGGAYVGQLADLSTTNGQNLSGNQLSAGLEIQYFFNVRWGFSYQYKLFNELTLETQTASGYTFKYMDGGGQVLRLIRNFNYGSVYATFSEDTFKTGSVGGSAADLSSKLKGLSFGVGIMFGNMIPIRESSGPAPKRYDGIPASDLF